MVNKSQQVIVFKQVVGTGGETGVRTLGRLAPSTVFETVFKQSGRVGDPCFIEYDVAKIVDLRFPVKRGVIGMCHRSALILPRNLSVTETSLKTQSQFVN
jgi:hypothetical protein